MFRPMRRFKQELSESECIDILNNGKTAVLAVLGDDDYPYTVPLNYVYYNGKIYLHCAKEGHKLDAIKNHDKVSICVVAQDDIVEEKYTTYFKSVVCFGRAKRMTDESLMRESVKALAEKYCPTQLDGIPTEVESEFSILAMIEIEIEHMSGKQCRELINKE